MPISRPLNACMTHARDNGAGRFAFLGDFVGYGADPQRRRGRSS